jgi:glycosyltransferase involved in cell wall biosynthesis
MKTLVKENYKVYVVSPYDEYSNEIEEIGCEFIDIKMDNKGSNPFNDLKLIYDLSKIYKNINPDLIIHYTIKPNIYGSFATKLVGCKSISVIPGLGYTFINDNLTAKIAKVLYKLALKVPKQVWFINQDDKNLFIEKQLVKKEKVFTINGEGVNIEQYKSNNLIQSNDKFIFLLIGRVIVDKGIYEYINAAKMIKDKYQDVEFQLMGLIADNPMAIQETEIKQWQKDNIITYLGSVDNVKEYIEQSNCIVLPSYREGVSMSLMEAASMSCPIITTNVTGCKEIVDDGINGYLCKVKNANDLASKMEMMINLSDDERKIMGQAGRNKIVKEFDEKIVINKYLESIKEILE